jgi:transposase
LPVVSAAADIKGWSAEIFGSGHYNVSDPAYCLRIAAAPNPGSDAQHSDIDGRGDFRTGLFYFIAPKQGTGVAVNQASGSKQGVGPPGGRQHGLKIFGEGEWLENKHKIKTKRKRWRKLHLGLDLVSGEIVCSDLTTDDVGDPTALPDLLDQVDGRVAKFIADGAYDGSPTRDLLVERLGEIVEVIIPPPKTAVASAQSALVTSVRDRHIAEIETKGRLAWQKSTGYNQRSRVETQMGRWKAVIGPKLRARNFDNQKTEAKIGVRVLNRMTELGRPEFNRVS